MFTNFTNTKFDKSQRLLLYYEYSKKYFKVICTRHSGVKMHHKLFYHRYNSINPNIDQEAERKWSINHRL